MRTPILQDPEHWRGRAAEMRRIADGLGVLALAKASMLRTAEEYDRLAARAEELLKSTPRDDDRDRTVPDDQKHEE
jgi:hypothetical protein